MAPLVPICMETVLPVPVPRTFRHDQGRPRGLLPGYTCTLGTPGYGYPGTWVPTSPVLQKPLASASQGSDNFLRRFEPSEKITDQADSLCPRNSYYY
eukprot:1309935-Rhodomonas_salina.2